MKLLLITLIAFFAGMTQAQIVDTENLAYRDEDVFIDLGDEEPPKSIDPKCGRDCSLEVYKRAQCYYLIGHGFRTFESQCHAFNAFLCEGVDFRPVNSGRCPGQKYNYDRV